MVYGGTDRERLQVNEESIWLGGPVKILVAVGLHIGGHGLGDRVTSRHRQGTALTERG